MLALQILIFVLTIEFLILALVWIMLLLHKRRGLLIHRVSSLNGIHKRVDLDLIEDLSLYLATFASSIFLTLNFVAYTILGVWAFGDSVGKGSVLVILIFAVFGILKRFYNSVKDRCGK